MQTLCGCRRCDASGSEDAMERLESRDRTRIRGHSANAIRADAGGCVSPRSNRAEHQRCLAAASGARRNSRLRRSIAVGGLAANASASENEFRSALNPGTPPRTTALRNRHPAPATRSGTPTVAREPPAPRWCTYASSTPRQKIDWRRRGVQRALLAGSKRQRLKLQVATGALMAATCSLRPSDNLFFWLSPRIR